MRPHPLLSILLASALLAGLAHAETYKWKDAQGRTIISDMPPPGNVKPHSIISTSAPAETDTAKSDAAKTPVDKDEAFRKRQQEQQEKASKEAKESATKAERAEDCERARRQLALLESGQRISTTDAQGERRFLDDTERQREIERAKRYIAETCK